MSSDPQRLVVDVGDRDPADPDAPGYDDRERPTIAELAAEELERELAFGSGMRQVLARAELERRAGDYQPSLFGPIERIGDAMSRRRPDLRA